MKKDKYSFIYNKNLKNYLIKNFPYIYKFEKIFFNNENKIITIYQENVNENDLKNIYYNK